MFDDDSFFQKRTIKCEWTKEIMCIRVFCFVIAFGHLCFKNTGVFCIEKKQVRELFFFIYSAANSISWGRLLPQVVYHVSSYLDLVQLKVISMGDEIDLCVPTGNFGNILAAYYAKVGMSDSVSLQLFDNAAFAANINFCEQ